MHSKIQLSVLCVVSALGATACSRTYAKLEPAANASLVAGVPDAAAATAGGVRLVARSEAWQWDPKDLQSKVTPLLVELHNDGTHTTLVRYNRIMLIDADGHQFHAMPPYDIDASLTEPYRIENPYYGYSRFAVAPYLSRYYPRMSRYGGAFAYDPVYYSPYITRYRAVQLPTVDMVQRALPEGVLSPGGTVSGFVYFESLDRDARTLTLAVEIVDAETNASLGTARIPFATR
jgi:hypothetical protein